MRSWHKLLVLCAALVGCVGTSVPQPPNLDPVVPELVRHLIMEDTIPPTIAGDPGSSPGDVEVWIWELDTTAPPLVAAADADGVFSIPIDAPVFGEVRFQARRAGERSRPVDAIAGSMFFATVDREPCLEVPLEVGMVATRQAQIEIENTCSAGVTLGPFALRAGEPALTIEAPASATLPAGGRLELPVRASGVATVEDILFVHAVVNGAPERYPVTVIAPAP